MNTEIASGMSDVRGSAAMRAALAMVKCAALWCALFGGAALASKLVPVHFPPSPNDGPLSGPSTFLVVSVLTTVTLAMLAERARVGGLRLGLLLFVALFATQTAMMEIEAWYFDASLHIPLPDIAALTVQGAVVAGVVAIVAALLYRRPSVEDFAVPLHLVWRIAGLAVVYVVLYYAAGYFIAWQSAAVRAFYSNGIHIALGPTVALQFGRGLLWALISLYVVANLRGSLPSRAVVMMVMFVVFATVQLLYPSAYMPWAVRQMHLIEMGTSEALYGLLAAVILTAGGRRAGIA